MIDFNCDYNCSAAPEVLAAVNSIAGEKLPVYGSDPYSDRARQKIRTAAGNPNADVWFLLGGTQTNACALDALLQSWQGVLCAESGHIAIHEAGAIEHNGHKVLPVSATARGTIDLTALTSWLEAFYGDATWPHMVQPGAVYISHPTELGCLYTLDELRTLRAICDRYQLKLYLDGARLGYALASPRNEITLKDLGCLCDAFYIGGTKCGTLMGEALVFKQEQPFFFPQHKQHGALLAKGFLLGVQFDALFTDDLYLKLGRQAIAAAELLSAGLQEKGFTLVPDTGTNQIFFRVNDSQLARLRELTAFDIWSRDASGCVVRLVTSWASTPDEVAEFLHAFNA